MESVLCRLDFEKSGLMIMINELKEDIEKHNKVIIWHISSVPMWHFFKGYCRLMIKNDYQNILCIYTTDLKYEDESEILGDSNQNIIVRKLDKQQMNEVMEIYHMYEFTDKIHIVSENLQYPSIINYVTTGVLKEEEFYKALLY